MKRTRDDDENRRGFYGVMRLGSRAYAWSARSHRPTATEGEREEQLSKEKGFALAALSNLGMLDPTANFDGCPGGCYPYTDEYHRAYLDLMGGRCNAVWLAENLNVDRYTGDILRGKRDRIVQGWTESEISSNLLLCLMHVQRVSAFMPEVTLVVPLASSIPDEPGGHLHLLVIRLYYKDAKTVALRYVAYDPQTHDDSLKRIDANASENLCWAFVRDISGYLVSTGYVVESTEREKSLGLPDPRGIQKFGSPETGDPESSVRAGYFSAGRRRGFVAAARNIAKEIGAKDRGYCGSYSMIMMVLAAMYPLKTTEELSVDIIETFRSAYVTSNNVSPAEAFAAKSTDISELVPVLRRGLNAVARTFGLTMHRHAERLAGKSVYCCPPALAPQKQVPPAEARSPTEFASRVMESLKFQ